MHTKAFPHPSRQEVDKLTAEACELVLLLLQWEHELEGRENQVVARQELQIVADFVAAVLAYLALLEEACVSKEAS